VSEERLMTFLATTGVAWRDRERGRVRELE
jgi:hypothetical protein